MILVTGGTGLLGSHVLYELIQQGKEVTAIKRPTSDTAMVKKVFSYYSEDADNLFEKIRWVDADLMDFGAISDVLEGVKEVYHVGAVVSFYPKDHKAMLKVNVEGTANLVNLSLDKGIEKFCYVSSVATLGRGMNGNPTSEEDYWVVHKRNTVYSVSKYGAEREIWRGMEEGLNAVIVNPSFILGPGFWNDNSGLFRLAWEGMKYYTDGINGYVDARDIARAMRLLMERNIFGERFILSTDNITYDVLFGTMAKYFGKPAPSVKIPTIIPEVIWRFEAARTFFTRSTPMLTREMAYTMGQKYLYTNEKIRKTLDFEFIPLEKSIEDGCKAYKKDIAAGELASQ